MCERDLNNVYTYFLQTQATQNYDIINSKEKRKTIMLFPLLVIFASYIPKLTVQSVYTILAHMHKYIKIHVKV